MSIFNIWDQAANTIVINRSVQTVLESQPRVAPAFTGPLIPTTDDKIKLGRSEVKAFGKGEFKAFDATPPIWAPRIAFSEEEIELVQLSEMTEIKESLLRRLKSTDQDISVRAGLDIFARARGLAIRNERLSDWMVMQSVLTGQLPINYKDRSGQGFVIDFQFDPTHLPHTSTNWSNAATATPIADMKAWQKLLADDAGDYGTHIWMNTTTWQQVLDSKELKDYLTGTDRGLWLPTPADLQKLLWEPERTTIHVTDAGYREASAGYDRRKAAHTKWIPDNRVIVTTDMTFEGERVVEQYDGLVAVQTDWNEIQLKMGAQSEVQVDGKPKVHWWIQTATRMVKVNKPECIVSAYTTTA